MTTLDDYLEMPERGGLIPILNPLNVECTLYMLRLTPFDKYNRTDVESFLSTITNNWICAKENSKKLTEHFHCTIYDDVEEELLREKIRTFLKIKFTDPAKRGDANKQYNLTVADSVEKGINYTVKELNITYGSGMNPEYINKRLKASFQKFDKAVFAKKLEDIKKIFKESYQSIGELMERIVQLKAEYRQPINLIQIHQLALSCLVNRDPTQAENLVRRFLENKNL